ncbi:hypothetical protein BDR22DRAFT_344404 [Usnea florida]
MPAVSCASDRSCSSMSAVDTLPSFGQTACKPFPTQGLKDCRTIEDTHMLGILKGSDWEVQVWIHDTLLLLTLGPQLYFYHHYLLLSLIIIFDITVVCLLGADCYCGLSGGPSLSHSALQGLDGWARTCCPLFSSDPSRGSLDSLDQTKQPHFYSLLSL